MAVFNGTLNTNEIFGSLFNMIISQQVFSDNISGGYSELVDEARVDGSLYGDQKLYYATNALKSYAWANDLEATNLLSLDRPKAPECQSIVLDQFRQIRLTDDNYLSKRAWSTEGAFSSFISVMLQWVRETKRIYDMTLYNAYIGANKSSVQNDYDIDITTATTGLSGEEYNRVEAQTIAQGVADLYVKMRNINREYNDYKYVRAYDKSKIRIIWNSKYINKITKVDIPTIYHKDGLFNDLDKNVLPETYFGNINTSTAVGDGSTIYAATELDFNTPGLAVSDPLYDPSKHVFAGELIPTGETAPAGLSYTLADNIIAKVVVKLPPFMSAFETGTNFFNPRSLTENHYLTWGHNTLEYLYAYPFFNIVEI